MTATNSRHRSAGGAQQELRDGMNHLRAGLFSAIEAVGFQSVKQENALKGLVRQLTYEAQASIEAALRRERGD